MNSARPNILLLITDQQSWKMMGCAGNNYVKTPNLDRLAAGGVRFENCFCSDPVCIPSRTSLLTGRMPGEFGERGNYLENYHFSPDDLCNALGNLMKNAGYEALYGGKVHVNDALHPANTGYEYFCPDEREILAEACVEQLSAKHEKPFFMVGSFINPHDICYQAICAFPDDNNKWLIDKSPVEIANLTRYLREAEELEKSGRWKEVYPPLPDNFEIQQDEPPAINEHISLRPFKVNARKQWGELEWRRHRYIYCRLTEQVDREIGMVLDALDKNNLSGNTLVVFTADHGDHDSSHRLEHKTIFYREAYQVPFIMRWPGKIPAGIVDRNHVIINGLDVAATCCAVAGAVKSGKMHGRNVLELFDRNNTVSWRNDVYLENECGFAVAGKDYLYALYMDGEAANNEQLYDLVNDPGQTRNAASDPEQQKILNYCRERLVDCQTLFYGGRRREKEIGH